MFDLDLRLECPGYDSPALDLDCDDALTLADAVATSRHLAGQDPAALCNMDADGNTPDEATDVTVILRLLVGLSPFGPVAAVAQ